MKTRTGLALLPLICAPSILFPVGADEFVDVGSGNGLFSALSHCSLKVSGYGKENPRQEDRIDCFEGTSYIRGVADALDITPDHVTYGQDYEIVYAYLKNHVNQRQHSSVWLIRKALAEAFPPPKR